MKAIKVKITGRVQGVFFRASTQKRARDLNLTGWVRNMPTGEVEAFFEGQEADVNEIISWCRQGPPAARVYAVECQEEPYRGIFDDFTIR